MTGSSNISKRKKKTQTTLAHLKKAAVTIAILDLILTISDCRNVGRFFLLVSMSSTFDITPENVIGDHCAAANNLRRGVCETYAQMMETGTLLPYPSELTGRRFHPSTFTTPNQHNVNADTETSSYLKATLSIQRLPEMFKELVTSWKSTFDPSRSETNISFYFDDDDEIPQMHEKGKQQQQGQLPPKPKQYQHHSAAESSTFASVSSSTSLKNPSPSSLPTRDGKNTIPTLNQNRASSTSSFSAVGESHEYSAGLEELHLNSHIRELDHDSLSVRDSANSFLHNVPSHHHTTLTSNDVTGTLQQTDDENKDNDISYHQPLQEQNFFKLNQEIGSSRKKRFTQPSQQQQSIGESTSSSSIGGKEETRKNKPVSQSNTNSAEIQGASSSPTFTSNTMGPEKKEDLKGRRPNAFTTSKTTLEKINSKSGPTIIPPPSQTSSHSYLASSPSSGTGKRGSDHSKPSKFGLRSEQGGKLNGSTTRSNPFLGVLRQKEASQESESETEGEKCLQSPTISGPKKMMGFLQQEMFSRWASLLETAGALINPSNLGKNLCIGEQLGSPEAGRIKMHIELKPFGPKPYQEAERREKATQQILFDSPWLTMIQLYSKLSGSFIKMFVVVSVYTLVWGTVLGLMLLIGSLTEEPVMIHCWIVFNILYSLLFFMIDDWIHSNINPCRSTVSIWLSISYSLYKPLATWVVLMQWSEMKKSLSPDKTGDDKSSSSSSNNVGGGGQCLNKTTIKGLTPQLSHPLCNSNPSLSTASETTKDSTIVDIADLNTTDIGPLYPNGNPVEKESNTAAALMLAVSTLRLGADNSVKLTAQQNQNADFDDFENDGGDYDEEEGEDEDDDEGDDDDDDDTEGEERERGDLGKGSESEVNTPMISTNTTTSLKRCGDRESNKSNIILARGRRSNGYVVTH